ncbi:BQ5605_C002g01619 [Microbotryum silenes-dioicae]|uniref:BQ5605_C002g01619 protein n=1 Tax=Microbotryum silenes-dioicae TaxID=796604 RepID=A0A2X0P285_9BASI|nr:BQ5605_C002g01619 [Microbotryum silenes-dioicae]
MDFLPLNPLTMSVSGLGMIIWAGCRHFALHKKITSKQSARGSFLFDEAFSVMKYFFVKATEHTVEEAQAFGNNFIPAPWWVRVVRVLIPLDTRLEANRILIDTLGEDDIQNVAGGKEWWQRCPNPDGALNGEWISMKKDWHGLGANEVDDDDLEKIKCEKVEAMKRKSQDDHKRRYKLGRQREERRAKGEDVAYEGDEEGSAYEHDLDEMRCILYIHGGAYFFGSPNTHRFSIWRYARKIGGRAFALQYRLSPQFPFPCALADALASYIYLIRPPIGAKHKPVDPKKLVIAGDSAGGGLTLALSCLIRDAGLPAPAGIVLISPWCDLTHSFPSILQNTETDVIPAFGLGLFKPSMLWPPPPAEWQERADRSTSIKGLKHAAETFEQERRATKKTSMFFNGSSRADRKGEQLLEEVEKFPEDYQRAEHTETGKDGAPDGSGGSAQANGESKAEVGKVLKLKIDGEEVEVRDQIQLYATNDQLVYPFVSPIWQPSLGGLPSMYVMCGDREVLRDEIVYMAHRAAHPDRYPVRQALLDANPERTKRHAEYPPTKVHLQIYDGMCHDLPLFAFTTPAKYCYRAISSFVKFVTADENESDVDGEVLASPVSNTGMQLPLEISTAHEDAQLHHERAAEMAPPTPISSEPQDINNLTQPRSQIHIDTSVPTEKTAHNGEVKRKRSAFSIAMKSHTNLVERANGDSPTGQSDLSLSRHYTDLEKTIYASTQPFHRPDYVDNMVRERVSLTGVVRPMEPEEEVEVLKIPKDDLGLVKEGPVKRYLAGKAKWDKKFKRNYEHVMRKREEQLKKSMREEAERISAQLKQRTLNKKNSSKTSSHQGSPSVPPSLDDADFPLRRMDSPEPIEDAEEGERDEHIHLGIWALPGERPPPSSIAARKDTKEARRLARVLDERYLKLSALSVWNEVHRMANKAAEPPGEDLGAHHPRATA